MWIIWLKRLRRISVAKKTMHIIKDWFMNFYGWSWIKAPPSMMMATTTKKQGSWDYFWPTTFLTQSTLWSWRPSIATISIDAPSKAFSNDCSLKSATISCLVVSAIIRNLKRPIPFKIRHFRTSATNARWRKARSAKCSIEWMKTVCPRKNNYTIQNSTTFSRSHKFQIKSSVQLTILSQTKNFSSRSLPIPRNTIR